MAAKKQGLVGLYSGRQIRINAGKRGHKLTRSQTAKQAYNSIIKKYGEIVDNAKYHHAGKGNWIRYTLANDRKRTGKVTTDVKKWRKQPHKFDMKGVDTKGSKGKTGGGRKPAGKKPRASQPRTPANSKKFWRPNPSDPVEQEQIKKKLQAEYKEKHGELNRKVGRVARRVASYIMIDNNTIKTQGHTVKYIEGKDGLNIDGKQVAWVNIKDHIKM